MLDQIKSERALDSFAPAVYIEFIRHRIFLNGRGIIEELIRYEAKIEYEEIQKKIDKIIDQKSVLISEDLAPEKLLKRIKKIQQEGVDLDRMWARQGELRAIMFPETTPEAIVATNRN